MANNAQRQGPPQGWAEKIMAASWQLREYRTRDIGAPFTPDEYARNRHNWDGFNLGRRGRRRLRGENVDPWIGRLIRRAGRQAPDINQVTPPNAGQFYRNAKQKLNDMRVLFAPLANINYIKAIGYGGNGLAIKFRYRNDFDFVMKVSLRSWESTSIRAEMSETRKVDRAAHCIQIVPRAKIGLLPQRPFAWEYPDEDDSSDPGESSGEESRDDAPGPEAQRGPRRPRNPAERNALMLKIQRATTRWDAQYDRIELRELAIAERQAQGVSPPREEDDPLLEERRADFLILEFCENGDLENLLYRINEANTVVPNRVLWGFWLCLIRSCVAMQYPPRKFHPRRREPAQFTMDGFPLANNRQDGKTVGNDLYEDVPGPRRRWAQKRQVHFDIDPQNILLTGIDVYAADNEHKIIPRLKLTDFGLAKEVKPRKRNIYYAEMRDMAKHGYLAPEQFGVDWEFIQPHEGGVGPGGSIYPPDGAELSEQPVAGNYGPHTNVWQIAIVAWQLMTKMVPPVPPQLQRKMGHHADLPDNYCAAILTEPAYDAYDLDLRKALARCMAHDPRERPTLRQLLQHAKAGINKVFADEPDWRIREWVQDLIYNA
ncbi:kinase-like domain-containing protein [Xylaria acuta]|nr:kinase-like domain-containing protein [Xylaria acuta]